MDFRKIAIIVLVLSALSFCTVSERDEMVGGETLHPRITGVFPQSLFAGSPELTLRVQGEYFSIHSQIFINGQQRVTEFGDNGMLYVRVLPGDLTVSGQDAGAGTARTMDGKRVLRVEVAAPSFSGPRFSGEAFLVTVREDAVQWTDTVTIADLGTANSFVSPEMEADASGHIYMAFAEYVGDHDEVMLVRSSDHGAVWTAKQNISNSVLNSWSPDIATDGAGNLYAVWIETEDVNFGEAYVYFTRSTDHGATWETPKRIFGSFNYCMDPRVYVEPGGAVDVIVNMGFGNTYSDGDLYFTRSTDKGGTWKTEVRIAYTDGNTRYVLNKDTASALHVAYDAGMDNSLGLYHAWSLDDGNSWESEPVSGEVSVFSGPFYPNLVSGAGIEKYMAWNYDFGHRVGPRLDTYFSAYDVSAGQWGAEVNLDEIIYPTTGTRVNMVREPGGRIFVLAGGSGMYLAWTEDGGQTWSPPQFIDKPFAHALSDMVLEGPNLYMVYSQTNKVYFTKRLKNKN